MIVSTTFFDVTGRMIISITQHIWGLVRGNVVRSRFIGRDIVAGLRMIVGGEIHEYTKLLAESREQALDRMLQHAQSIGADAVIGVRFRNHRRWPRPSDGSAGLRDRRKALTQRRGVHEAPSDAKQHHHARRHIDHQAERRR
jgi:uncharacterized protein YbjQ (UPF0145 family)